MQEISLPLNFSTFYTFGIKDYTNLGQKRCINILLLGTTSDSFHYINTLDDSVCSNYAKGKKDISDYIRIDILQYRIEELSSRIHKVGIHDYSLSARALAILVQNSSLSPASKKELLDMYSSYEPLAFITHVFRKSIEADNAYDLNDIEIYDMRELILNNPVSSFDDINNMNANYNNSHDSTTYISHTKIQLPFDYDNLIQLIEPEESGFYLDAFNIKSFLKINNIDPESHTIVEGSLELWTMKGSIDNLAGTLRDIQFLHTTALTYILSGMITLRDTQIIQNAFFSQKNYHSMKILISLIADKKKEVPELIIITHTNYEQ